MTELPSKIDVEKSGNGTEEEDHLQQEAKPSNSRNAATSIQIDSVADLH